MFMNNYARSNYHVIKNIHINEKHNTIIVSEKTTKTGQKSNNRMIPSKTAHRTYHSSKPGLTLLRTQFGLRRVGMGK